MQNLVRLAGFIEGVPIIADPSIFHATKAQAEGGFKSIADLPCKAGLDGFWEGENAGLLSLQCASRTTFE